jgi:hypothetical protein
MSIKTAFAIRNTGLRSEVAGGPLKAVDGVPPGRSSGFFVADADTGGFAAKLDVLSFDALTADPTGFRGAGFAGSYGERLDAAALLDRTRFAIPSAAPNRSGATIDGSSFTRFSSWDAAKAASFDGEITESNPQPGRLKNRDNAARLYSVCPRIDIIFSIIASKKETAS